MESGINARTIDFAKLGRLYLNGGVWGDRQVAPAQWVEAAFAETPRSPDADFAFDPVMRGTPMQGGTP